MNNHDHAQPAVAGCDMRRRTPVDIAAQLQRDATSLVMTGQSFEKDKAFYDHVAANIREAAELLAAWDAQVEDQKRRRIHQFRNGTRNGVTIALALAEGVRNPMPRARGPATAWCNACDAIINGLQALEASDLTATGEDQ